MVAKFLTFGESMIHGQWWGRIEGANRGEVLMNIDQARAGQSGSISFSPDADTDGIPLIAKIHFQKCTEKDIEAEIHEIIGFSKDGNIVLPHSTEHSTLSSKAILKATLTPNILYLQGEWKTELGYTGKVTLNNLASLVFPAEINPISWSDFKSEISDNKKYPYETFYRGQCDSRFVLSTSFHRKHCWDLRRYHEKVINELFENMAILNDIKYTSRDLDSVLFLAQHHNFPTPLLDWTISPYVAAYFAFRDINAEHRPSYVRVYIFDAWRWARDFPNYNLGGLVSPGILIKPLKISTVGNRRAAIQNGRCLFTNIERVEPILRYFSNQMKSAPYLRWFDLAMTERETILHDLKLMNISELSLFPDIGTACRLLCRKYFSVNE